MNTLNQKNEIETEGQLLLAVPANFRNRNRYFPAFDFDNMTKEEVKKEMYEVMHKFNMPSFLLFRTSGRKHYCSWIPCTVTLEEYFIMVQWSKADEKFRRVIHKEAKMGNPFPAFIRITPKLGKGKITYLGEYKNLKIIDRRYLKRDTYFDSRWQKKKSDKTFKQELLELLKKEGN